MPESPEAPSDPGRQHLLSYLRQQLIGPAYDNRETLTEPPNRRYSMGVLYPIRIAMSEVEREEQPDLSGSAAGRTSSDDDPIRMASEWFPASVGVSFHIPADTDIEVRTWGAKYEQISVRPRTWERHPIATPGEPEVHVLAAGPEPAVDIQALRGAARLSVRRRPLGTGTLVTVTLVNAHSAVGEEKVDPADCLYQVGISCRPIAKPILEYPAPSFLTAAEDELELRLLYRWSHTYAVGHGCAAGWDSDASRPVREIRTEFLPTVDVPPVTQVAGGSEAILSIARLADDALPVDQLVRELSAFVDSYGAWRDRLRSDVRAVPEHLLPTAGRLLDRIERAEKRMRRGIATLEADADVLDAFRLAQHAMLVQMRHSADDLGGTVHPRNATDASNIDYTGLPYTWYPFQLAFQLLVLESAVDSESEDRNIVDLLWFPTGGGKTEAYLAIAALEIFLRRLRHGDAGGGTAILTRYTLRLLTTQQFQRTAAMICAAETIRRRSNRLGDEPITVGLWVGGDATPNTCAAATEMANDVLDQPKPSNPFPLQRCPWCGTEIVPRRKSEPNAYGFRTDPCLHFRCPTSACSFHEWLPVSVVDEDQYATPPTFLLATVDKLARLAWLDEPTVFFGTDRYRGPSLIIQDELHLLTGPLGTTFGLYEHAIAETVALRGETPKLIASTATIRRAYEQSTALFGRPIELFPPSGLSADDSYFAKWDRTRPGRTYAGVMTPAHTMATALVHISSALLEGATDVSLTPEERDSYWTLVAYHNSLRELGRTMTLARDDIPTRIAGITEDDAGMREVNDDNVVELTGHVQGWEIPQILNRLEQGPEGVDAVSVLCSTNMLSVGVDVGRLGLMLVNGQPKQASEYIQATSRVGRSGVPGLVVTLYSAAKPRDRSHYESFIPFHEALYRNVEPASVTPFALPSRRRALHAAMVILARHGLGLDGNRGANRMTDVDAREIRRVLLRAVERADRYEQSATERHIDTLLEDWKDRIDAASAEGKTLHYNAPGKQSHSLITNYGDNSGEWQTLHSMRNVDRESRINALGETWYLT